VKPQWPPVARLIVVTVIGAGLLGAAGSPARAITIPVRARGAVTRTALRPLAVAKIRAAARRTAPAVADTGRRVKRGRPAPAMSTAMRRANTSRQAAARIAVAARRMPWARKLKATQRHQFKNYFCGPATVAEMLAQVGVTVHQRRAARELRTSRGGTDWSGHHGYPVPRVLNKNQKINNYVAVALPWSPTRRQLHRYERDLVADVNHRHHGVPLAGNAYEVPGGPHLIGHPAGETVFHWFDIRGYRKSGKITDYEDSVHGAPSVGWSAGVPAYSQLSSRVIVNILGARGYVW
jgi:hypothetical protein